uniref:Unplaced genomic scaffold supercont1.3, whole genome shotgun sequence n=1 Tax=Cryptococcus bacillisporus CA1280 TaxID=1296109 RepID=A0A0D0VQ11_CRYGA|nr:hypothetical protein I312_01420 [Cryptococcus bacillisporus CA1280]
MPIAVVNTWLYGPRWFYNPLITPHVPTYNVAPLSFLRYNRSITSNP